MTPAMPVSTILPASVRANLVRASRIAPDLPPGESDARLDSVNAAVAFARVNHPEYFREPPVFATKEL